jgi:microcystin-dependent protein
MKMRTLLGLVTGASVLAACSTTPSPPSWGPDYYMSQVRVLAGTYCPSGSVLANGQLLDIQDHQALYSLIGNRYGGNGTTNFAVPDLTGTSIVIVGQQPFKPAYPIASRGGRQTASVLPRHSHSLNGSGAEAEVPNPANALLPTSAAYEPNRYATDMPGQGVTLNDNAITSSGFDNASIELFQPVMSQQFCFQVTGPYPYRSEGGSQ